MQEQQSLFYLINVIKNYKLDQEEVANVLFPTIANPDLALRRLLTGKGRVMLDQLEILAQYIGVSVPTLYEAGCNIWADNSTQDCLRLSRGIYKVEYIYSSGLLIITRKDTVIHSDNITADIQIQGLIETINNIIDRAV